VKEKISFNVAPCWFSFDVNEDRVLNWTDLHKLHHFFALILTYGASATAAAAAACDMTVCRVFTLLAVCIISFSVSLFIPSPPITIHQSLALGEEVTWQNSAFGGGICPSTRPAHLPACLPASLPAFQQWLSSHPPISQQGSINQSTPTC
jgi:hypothetical protein